MGERDLILVVDFGGDYTQLVARRIREAHVYCEVVPYTVTGEEIQKKKPQGLVLLGGPASVDDKAPVCDPDLLQEYPVLGIGEGMQLLVRLLGEKVTRAEQQETAAPGIPAAIFNGERLIYGAQFYLELRDTPRGQEMIENFLYDICGCRGDWTPAAFIEEQIASIRKTVGSSRVVGALSGGVDSTVAATLVHRAIGDQLTCIFVDHGLLRKGEREQVTKIFQEKLGVNTITVDARERFLTKLSGVTDPEKKRKIIGHEFIRVFEEEASGLGDFEFLLQGTIYPDVIESGTSATGVVKSHHNVGGLPDDMRLRLLEPLRLLFKDEVRLIGQELGLSEDLVWRQPFPGPGLAVRVLGEVTEEKLDLVRDADYILREEIRRAGLDREIWQYFAALLPVRSVGVVDGERTYAHPIVLRAVTSEDAMTAGWARLPYDLLERIANRILGDVPGINRVTYDITPKPPGTIEWE